ncbi:MAG: DNA translocase FtsK 4TM domain-containing protein [Alphaproteobacteria bacterium]
MATSSMPGRRQFDLTDFLARRFTEALGIGLCLLSLVLAVALWGYDASDPSLNYATSGPSSNPLGSFGAVLADLCLQTVGTAIWLAVLVMPIWGVRLILDRVPGWIWLSVAALPPAILALATYFATFDVPPIEVWPYLVGLGGVVGDFALHRLEPALGASYGLYTMLASLLLGVIAIGITPGEAVGGIRNMLGLTTHYERVSNGPLKGQAAANTARGPRPEPGQPGIARRALGGLGGAVAGLFGALFRRRGGAEVDRSRITRNIHIPVPAEADLDDEPMEAPDRPGRRPRKRLAPEQPVAADPPPEIVEPAENFELPPLKFLAQPRRRSRVRIDDAEAAETAKALEKVLDDFGVRGEIVAVKPGPVITLYELEPAPGTRAARVIALADDIARSLCAMSVRVAVVPGRNVIGIELPNEQRETVYLSELLSSEAYEKTSSGLGLALGKDISGEPVVVDLAKMPHLLIAGTTGSGKSVSINAMILSLLYRMPPSACKLIMIDPKVIELSVYDGIPHLLAPVVTEPHKAVVALKWIVREMDDRYRLMSHLGVRDIFAYNRRISEAISRGEQLSRKVQTGFEPGTGVPIFEQQPIRMETLPLIVVIVDEVADLMLTAGKEIEGCIQRLSQKARAAGVHLIVATQRPSVDVLTGVIKANLPARISFRVSSKIDSRTILGEPGAEQLLGQGDMLQMMAGDRTTRIHGPLVTDEEVERVVTYLKSQGSPDYIDAVTNEAFLDNSGEADGGGGGGSNIEINNEEDAQYAQALQIVAKEGRASTSFLQRKLRIGYNSAARLIERMEQDGHVSSPDHVGRRKVLMGGGDDDGPSGVDAPW